MPKTISKISLKKRAQKSQINFEQILSEKYGWTKYRLPDHLASKILENIVSKRGNDEFNFGPNCPICKPWSKGYPKYKERSDYIGCKTHYLDLNLRTNGVRVQISIKPWNKFVVLVQYFRLTLFVLYFDPFQESNEVWRMSNWMCTCPYSCAARSRPGRQLNIDVDWYSDSYPSVPDEIYKYVEHLSSIVYRNNLQRDKIIHKTFGHQLIIDKISQYIIS